MESVFQRVGTCGCFQVCHVACIQLIRMVNSWCMDLMVFGNYEPPWECVQRYDMSDNSSDKYSAQEHGNTSRFGFTEKSTSSSSSKDVVTSSNLDPNLTYDNVRNHSFRQGTCEVLPLCDNVQFDPTSVTLVTEFGLICDQAYIPSLIIAVQMCGMIVGTTLGGQISELFGRKISIYSSLAVMSVACLVAAWSTSWQMFAILIFFVGVGEGGILSSHLLYAMEFLTPVWRGRFTATPFWESSLILFAVIVTCLKNWRHVQMLVGVMAAVLLLSALWVPESLRWLHVHEKDSQAKKVIGKIMKCNGCEENIDDVFHEFKNNSINDEDTKPKERYTYLHLFRERKIKELTMKTSIATIFASMCFFTIGFSVKSFSGDYYLNLFLSTLLQLPFLAMLSLCINRLGRRLTASLFVCASNAFMVACVIAYYVTDYEVAGPIITYLALIAKGLAGMAWVTINLLKVELFPTAVRGLAVGLLSTFERLGVIVGTILIPRDQESLAVSFIVFSVVMLISCVIVLSLPETMDKPLQYEIPTVSCSVTQQSKKATSQS